MVTRSGRGDKDVRTATRWFGLTGEVDQTRGGDAVELPEDIAAHAEPLPEEI